MLYIIYKTINLINKKYYIGCHQTLDINDNYLGSGKHLKRAIKKYGKENFKFEILHILNSKEEMFNMEQHIVNESLVKDPMSYNLKIGGSGGNPGIMGAFSGKCHSNETKEKLRISGKNNASPWERMVSKYGYEEAKKINSKGNKSGSKNIPKSDEHKEKLRKSAIEKQSGKKNLGKIRDTIKCPYCTKVGSKNTMFRWHFENCKKYKLS
jgi:hypothetical protein